MKSSQTDTLKLALQLGILTGVRATSGFAVLSNYAVNKPKRFKKTRFKLLASENVNMGLRLAAAGEMVMDKLPFVGDRTSRWQLLGRIVWGALVGAALSAERKEPLANGAVVAAVGAIVGAVVGTNYRHFVSGKLHMPNVIAGLVEDSAAIWYGVRVLGPELDS